MVFLWRDLAVFSTLSLTALLISVLLTLDVKIPSPMIIVKYLIKDVINIYY